MFSINRRAAFMPNPLGSAELESCRFAFRIDPNPVFRRDLESYRSESE